MGASSAITEMMLFIASMIIVTGVIFAFMFAVQNIAGGVEDREHSMSDQLRTEICIVNDPNNVPNDPVLIYVKNIGSVALDPFQVTMVLDGKVHDDVELILPGNNTVWVEQTILTLKVDVSLEAGDHEAHVSTENGMADGLRFRI